MSSHCNRYPACGCNSYCGTKCQLPEGDPRLLEKEEEFDVEKMKREFDEDWEKRKRKIDGTDRPIKSSKGKRPSNFTPPKKKRK